MAHSFPRGLALAALAATLSACGDGTGPEPTPTDGACARTQAVATLGCITNRFTAELAVHGTTAYTTTWGERGTAPKSAFGNAIYVWDVSGTSPVLVDSVVIANAGVQDIGDVAVSPDGTLLIVSTEYSATALVVYDLANPRKPVELSRYVPSGGRGAHTAEIGVVNGKLHAFLAANAGTGAPARIIALDLSNPRAPTEAFSRNLQQEYVSFMHDAFYRDGALFLALWDAGLVIWDLGGLGKGGTPTAPVEVGRVQTQGGNVHNAWWFHDPATGSKRWLFVGEESTTGVQVLLNSRGDIHVVDLADPTAPREVGYYHAPDLAGQPVGTHNFSMDEARGILYAAYYNGGVHALDVRGDLAACTAAQKDALGRCELGAMGRVRGRLLQSTVAGAEAPYVWGVQYAAGFVYAADMVNGLWKLPAVTTAALVR